jgi:hypothetical protein
MVKKKKIGKVVFNWKGYKLRHVTPTGGKLAVFTGKKRHPDFPNEFGTYLEGVNTLKNANLL